MVTLSLSVFVALWALLLFGEVLSQATLVSGAIILGTNSI